MWDKLSGLLLELWSKKTISVITSRINKVYYVGEGCIEFLDKRVAWFLVEVDISGGLPREIDIFWGAFSIRQHVDFWGIPFRCNGCKNTGHLLANFPF